MTCFTSLDAPFESQKNLDLFLWGSLNLTEIEVLDFPSEKNLCEKLGWLIGMPRYRPNHKRVGKIPHINKIYIILIPYLYITQTINVAFFYCSFQHPKHSTSSWKKSDTLRLCYHLQEFIHTRWLFGISEPSRVPPFFL